MGQQLRPGVQISLTEKTHGAIQVCPAAAQPPTPAARLGQQRPDGYAQCSRKMGGRAIYGDEQIQTGNDISQVGHIAHGLYTGFYLRDRTSVVSGKSVSVRVALGGRRMIKKKTTVLRKYYTQYRTTT